MKREDIDNLASLARLDVSSAERDALAHDLGRILEYVSELQQAPHRAADFPATNLVHNVWREDGEKEYAPDEFKAELLESIPERLEGGYIKVKKIL